jgi:hypothetical protein
MAGLVVLAVFVIVAIFASVFADHDQLNPVNTTGNPVWAPPTEVPPLGTDSLGRPIWDQLVYGSQVSLLVGVAATLIAVIIGTIVGAAGTWWIDRSRRGHEERVWLRDRALEACAEFAWRSPDETVALPPTMRLQAAVWRRPTRISPHTIARSRRQPFGSRASNHRRAEGTSAERAATVACRRAFLFRSHSFRTSARTSQPARSAPSTTSTLRMVSHSPQVTWETKCQMRLNVVAGVSST